MLQAYCFKCRGKVEIKNPKETTLKNGRPATEGVCPKCETRVFRVQPGGIAPSIGSTEA